MPSSAPLGAPKIPQGEANTMPLSMQSDGLYSKLFFHPTWYAEVVVYSPLRRFCFGMVVQSEEDNAEFVMIGLLFLRVTIGRRPRA